MNTVNFYVLISIYFIFTLVALYMEYHVIRKNCKFGVADFFKVSYIAIYGIIPVCSLIMLYTGEAFELKAFKYLETQNDLFKYIVCFSSIVFYFVVNKVYNVFYKKYEFKKLKFPVIDSDSKYFYVGNTVAMIIGWIALFVYTRAYGSVFGIFEYAPEIRDNIFRVNNSFTFMQPISVILIWSSLNYVILLRNMRGKSIGYKFSTIVLSLISFFGYFVVLISNDGRMMILGQILIIVVYLLSKSKLKISNLKKKHIFYALAFVFIMIFLMFQLNNITGLIRNDNNAINNVDYNPIKFASKEFSYTYVNDLNILERLVNKHNVDIRLDDNIVAAAITYIPRRYKKALVQDLFRYNTSFTDNAIGLIPTDVISGSLFSMSYFGYFVFMLWIPLILVFIQRFFDNNNKNGDFYKLLFPYLGIFMMFRLVAYYDIADWLYCCFPLVLTSIIIIGFKCAFLRKFVDFVYHSISNIHRIIVKLMNKRLFNWLSDEKYLKLRYRMVFGKKLDLNNPKEFNAKLQWLKLYDRNEKYVQLVDKIAVKDYVSKLIGKEYLIETLGVYDKFDDINFSKLPNQFVIKCSHDSGGLCICKNKKSFDKLKARKKIEKCLSSNYYYLCREWPYKEVKPRIIIEKYMEDKKSFELIDYKVLCFNGRPKMIFTCTDRYSDGLKVTFFDLDWNKLPFERHYPSSKKDIKKPKNLKKMIELSKKMAKDIPFVRIDWYEINGKLYFGEYTFYPGSGFEEFTPEEWDTKVGEMINLPK